MHFLPFLPFLTTSISVFLGRSSGEFDLSGLHPSIDCNSGIPEITDPIRQCDPTPPWQHLALQQ